MHEIRTATPKDLKFLIALQRKNSNEIGFIPTAGVEVYIERGHVTLCTENGDPAGFLMHRPQHASFRQAAHIVQACVCYDARRRQHGLDLVTAISQQAMDDGRRFLQLWCLRGIEANVFWHAAGFTAVCERWAATGRRRPSVLWRKPLLPGADRGLRTMPLQAKLHGPGGLWINTADTALRYCFNRTSTAEQLHRNAA